MDLIGHLSHHVIDKSHPSTISCGISITINILIFDILGLLLNHLQFI